MIPFVQSVEFAGMARFFLAVIALLLASSGHALAGKPPDLPPSHSVRPKLYATGLVFAEGPALDATGNLYVVNLSEKGTIGVISPQGHARILCDLRQIAPVKGRRPQGNGLKIDREGWLIVADFGGGRLLRVSPDGSRVTNCHFHREYLYLTVDAAKAVFRLDLGVPGFDYSGVASLAPKQGH